MTEIGIIGLGDMGAVYADCFAQKGLRVNACDVPERYEELREQYKDRENIHIFPNGYGVVRRSDLSIYCVETANIANVVAKFGASTKFGAFVGGQTSVKTPEIEAFEKYLPEDVKIVTCHSLHGPKVSPIGQTLVITRYRCSDEEYRKIFDIYKLLGSNMVEMSYEEHDKVTADTQVSTHIGFQAMGTAWKNIGIYPWEDQTYTGGIENVKVLMALRIFSMKSHVYSGLAILNPHAKYQVQQYCDSVGALWKMMIQENKEEFTERIKKAGEFVFGNQSTKKLDDHLLLPDDVLDEYGLGVIPATKMLPNSHLSLLAMVDCWYKCNINPYSHLICQTPVFRLRLGIAEYLFKNEEILNQTINCALFDKAFRGDDIEFFAAVREWTTIIKHGDSLAYDLQYKETQRFFESRLQEGKTRSSHLIEKLAQKNKKS